MPVELDWQIDQDESEAPWEPPPAMRRSPPPGRTPRARGAATTLLVLLVLIIALPGGWLLASQDLSRTSQAGAVLALARREDALAAGGDRPALLALQDADYPGWREWIAAGLASPDTPVAGQELAAYWDYRPTAGRIAIDPVQYGTVALGPDGMHAQLVVTREYVLRAWRAGPQPVLYLGQTQYYRLANGRWVHTGPPLQLAARLTDQAGPLLELRYPSHDAALIAPLYDRLAALAARACVDLGCPAPPPTLVISAVPADLATYSARRPHPDAVLAFAPAPLLGGAPAGGAGDDTLYRLYGVRLVTAIAARSAGTRADAMRYWLQWELAHLGLTNPLPDRALVGTAQRALRDGTNPLKGQDTRYAGVWLALNFLSGIPDLHPLRDVLDHGYAINASARLDLLVGERAGAWRAFLAEVTARRDTPPPPG